MLRGDPPPRPKPVSAPQRPLSLPHVDHFKHGRRDGGVLGLREQGGEEEGDLAGCRGWRVRTVHQILGHDEAEISPDRA